MARKVQRSVSAAWARRNARAINLGYDSYYDYRVHGYGKLPPSAAVDPRERPALRGHRSFKDLRRDVGEGDVVSVLSTKRDLRGRVTEMQVVVLGFDGKERTYTLKGKQLTPSMVRRLSQQIADAGATQAPGYPLMQTFAHSTEAREAA